MEKDVPWKNYFYVNRRYADVINGVGCGGMQLVKDTDLQDEDPTEKKKSRDLLRKVAFGVNFGIIGIENQDKVDYKFPVRSMYYDASRYHRQTSAIGKEVRENPKGLTPEEYLSRFKKDSKLNPQVNFVLYAGEEEWDGPTCLHDMLDFTDIPESLKSMVSDYKINIIDIRRLEDTSIFKTDVKQVFDFIRCSKDKGKLVQLVEKDEYYQHMEEDAFEVVARYTNSKELIAKEEYKVEGGKHNVCQAIRDLMYDSKIEGREEGLKEGSRNNSLENARNFFVNGASYELVRASILLLSDEELQSIYAEVMANKQI